MWWGHSSLGYSCSVGEVDRILQELSLWVYTIATRAIGVFSVKGCWNASPLLLLGESFDHMITLGTDSDLKPHLQWWWQWCLTRGAYRTAIDLGSGVLIHTKGLSSRSVALRALMSDVQSTGTCTVTLCPGYSCLGSNPGRVRTWAELHWLQCLEHRSSCFSYGFYVLGMDGLRLATVQRLGSCQCMSIALDI
jgi:hypothetical protein